MNDEIIYFKFHKHSQNYKQTNKQKKISVKNCFIRGSVVRYVHLPAKEIDTGLLQDSTRVAAREAKKH